MDGGVALDGGVVTSPVSPNVVVSVLSRWNPNTLTTSDRTYYVGARNLDPVNPATFRATLVCGKRIEVKRTG